MPRYTCKKCQKSFLVEENMKQHSLGCYNSNKPPVPTVALVLLQTIISYVPQSSQTPMPHIPIPSFYRYQSKGKEGAGYYLSKWHSHIITDAFTTPHLYMETLGSILTQYNILNARVPHTR